MFSWFFTIHKMALQLSFNICPSSNCKNLIFYESTGVYDSTTNTLGYGAPNDTVASATTATLAITFPTSTGSSTNTTVTINLYSIFPTSNINQGYIIYNTDLNLAGTSALPDGLYTFVYTVTANSTVYTQTVTQEIFCALECCVAGKFAEISDTTCDCASDEIDEALKAFTYLIALCYTSDCGNTTVMTNYYTILNDLCNNEDCGCS